MLVALFCASVSANCLAVSSLAALAELAFKFVAPATAASILETFSPVRYCLRASNSACVILPALLSALS